jgi:hypothetical protein
MQTFPVLLLITAVLLSACNESPPNDEPKKPEILKTQLETLDKAKQLESDAKTDAEQQQQSIDSLTK